MGRDAERVLDAALKLTEGERAGLAAILVDSLGDGHSQDDVDAAWLAEAKDRLERVRAGTSELIASEEVEDELDRIIETHVSKRAAG